MMNKGLLRKIKRGEFPSDFVLEKKKSHVLTSKVVLCDRKKVLAVQIFSVSKKLIYILYFWKNKNNFTVLDIKSNKFIQRKFENLIGRSYCSRFSKFSINKASEETVKKYFDSQNDCVSAINDFIDEIYLKERKRINSKKYKLIDDELRSIKPLTKKFHKWLENEAIEESRYIFYKRKNKKIDGVCTYCKNNVTLLKALHNDFINCPSCTSKVQLKSQGLAKNLVNRSTISYIESDKNKNVFIRIFDVIKTFKKYDEAPQLTLDEFQRYKITSDFKVKSFKNDYNNYFGKRRWSSGYYIYGFRYNSQTELGEIYTDNFESIFKHTQFQDINLTDLFSTKDNISKYNLYLDSLFEKLVSNSYLKYLINEKLYNLAFDRDINEKHLEILIQNKDRYSLIKELNPTIEELTLIKFLIENKQFFNLDDFLVLRKIGVSSQSSILKDFRNIIENYKYVSFKRIVNYMEKVTTNSNISVKENFDYWRDYLKMSLDMNLDLTNKSKLFPRDLKDEHDKITRQYNSIVKEIENKKIEEQYYDLVEKYYYEDEFFSIIPPKNANEIIYEGKTLKHCVSSYIEKVVKRDSTVLFLRNNNEINQPFYTIELMNGKINQCRTLNNKSATEDIEKFLKKWKTNILQNKKDISLVC